MAKDDAGGVVFDPPQGDEGSALGYRLAAGNLETLGIAIEGRLWILPQNARLAPGLEGRGRPGIDVFGGGIRRQTLAQDDSYEVVRAGLVITCLHCRGDFVVRLGHDLPGRDAVREI